MADLRIEYGKPIKAELKRIEKELLEDAKTISKVRKSLQKTYDLAIASESEKQWNDAGKLLSKVYTQYDEGVMPDLSGFGHANLREFVKNWTGE